jgi:hypothetical protein
MVFDEKNTHRLLQILGLIGPGVYSRIADCEAQKKINGS